MQNSQPRYELIIELTYLLNGKLKTETMTWCLLAYPAYSRLGAMVWNRLDNTVVRTILKGEVWIRKNDVIIENYDYLTGRPIKETI